jgi:hypothetical protein
MLRLPSACLVVAASLALRYASVCAQNPPSENGKTPDPVKPVESVARPTLDKMKLPPGAVVVVVDEVKEALALFPKMILMTPAEYQRLLDRLAVLEKQLKTDKKTVHACKIAGRLEGDFLLLKAEFIFTTEQPWTTVLLGMQGAHLTDEGELDRRIPLLDVGDDGFLVRVEKKGTHQLALNLKVPVSFKRPTATGGSDERGFDLSLPGAAVTTLALDLPAGVKEVRWNDTLEKPSRPNRWELALGKIKTLSVSWKEPVSLPGNMPLLTADSQITVKLDDNQVLLSADITLVDVRAQTKEWQLLLPQNAKVEVKASPGLRFDLLYPDGKRLHHVIRLAETSGERLVVHVEVRYPRPLPASRLPVGPFVVLGTYRQEGTITVLASAESLHGERLYYHHFGDIYPRDLPKGAAGTDVAAIYKFWNMPTSVSTSNDPPLKVPLELELKLEKSPADATIDHFLQLKPGERGWVIDVATTILVKSRPSYLDVQLPRFRVLGFGLLGSSAGVGFPAALSWLPLAPLSGKNIPQALPVDFWCEDEGLKLVPPNAQGRARLTWNRSPGQELKLTGKYLVPAGADRLRIELPRPLDVLDRGGKVRIKAPEQVELVVGSAASDGTAPDKHDVQLAWDTFPQSVEIAWKPYLPKFPVAGLTDIWLHDRSAEVKHQLHFTVPRGLARPGLAPPAQVHLRVPAVILDLTVVSGGKLILHDPANESAWILATAEPLAQADIVLRYDFPLPKTEGAGQAVSRRVVQVPLVWPENATREDAKVRVWSEAGVRPLLGEIHPAAEAWSDQGVEIVPGSEVLPSLVVRGSGLDLPLALRLVEPTSTPLASLVTDRALVQVAIDEEGTHRYRARYLVSKLNARHLDIEFPIPAANCLVNVWLDKKKINNWEPWEGAANVAQIPVQPKLYHQPIVLEIDYQLPASFTESNRLWHTTLYAPQFRGDVFLGRVRWQVGVPFSWVALAPSDNMDYRWGMQGWLVGPEPSTSSNDPELWFREREALDPPMPVSLALTRAGPDNVQLWHPARQAWLLLCSGLLLAMGLAFYLLPLPRTLLWLAALGLGTGVLAGGLLWPGLIPALVFGCEPGALVLIVLVGIQWMLQKTYRRRLVFMPGFNRRKANSSLIRAANNNRQEAPTIDAPTAAAGSAFPMSQDSNKGT